MNSGATAIEYGLIAALIAVVIITAVTAVGTQLSATFNNISTTCSKSRGIVCRRAAASQKGGRSFFAKLQAHDRRNPGHCRTAASAGRRAGPMIWRASPFPIFSPPRCCGFLCCSRCRRGPEPSAIGWHLLAGLLGLVLGFALFALGYIGGGDAKLFAVTVLWLGFKDLMPYAAHRQHLPAACSRSSCSRSGNVPLPQCFPAPGMDREAARCPFGHSLWRGAGGGRLHSAAFDRNIPPGRQRLNESLIRRAEVSSGLLAKFNRETSAYAAQIANSGIKQFLKGCMVNYRQRELARDEHPTPYRARPRAGRGRRRSFAGAWHAGRRHAQGRSQDRAADCR